MRESIFFRLLKAEDKETALQRCLAELRAGRDNELTHTVRQATFALLPGSPMPYWVSDAMRQKFRDLPSFEGNSGTVKAGLCTGNDFRFVRARWEVPVENIACGEEELEQGKRWVPFAKGGEYSPYYYDIHLVVDWTDTGQSMLAYPGARVQNKNYYFRSGLTYPLRTQKGFSVRYFPAGCIFGHKGPCAFQLGNESNWYLLGLLNCKMVQVFLEMMMAFGSYEVGTVQNIPYISPSQNPRATVEKYAQSCHNLKRDLDRVNETAHSFTRPALLGLQIPDLRGQVDTLIPAVQSLQQRFQAWLTIQEAAEVQVIENSYRIDQTVLDLYDISMRDRCTIDQELGPHPGAYPRQETWTEADDEKLRLLYLTKEFLPNEAEADSDDETGDNGQPAQRRTMRRTTYRTLEEVAQALQVHPASVAARRQALGLYQPDDFGQAVADLISYCLGCLFGRWDIRIGAGELEPTPLPDPEEGLPLYPPAALRPDSPPLKPVGGLAPLLDHSARHAILVDDEGHPQDLVAGIEACLGYLFGEEQLPSLRTEITAALGRNLRDWLARSFFAWHLKRYSKSRRKAPIYWQLATPGRRYSLWLYYHGLQADTLYTAAREYVTPKIAFETTQLKELQEKAAQANQSGPAREARRLERAVETKEELLQELYAFRSELQRLADGGYDPDLNDGVIINIAPLHRLVPWSDARKMWQALTEGEYPWSSMAKKLNTNPEKRAG